MQKIKYIVLDKMIYHHCTSAEIDFLLHLSHYQDDSGRIRGVYYRDICRDLGISKQKFYDIKRSLIDKNIIVAQKEDYSDWDIIILDNDFTNTFTEAGELNPADRYISTANSIFYDKDFYALKAGEKLLAMQFLKISFAGRGSYNIGVDKFYQKYMEMFHVEKRAIQNYMTHLRRFFSIGVKEKQYWITPLAKTYRNRTPKDADAYGQHIGEMICRRKKIKFTKETFRDTVSLLKQYANQLKNQVTDVFLEAVTDSLAKANEHIRNRYKWDRKLQPKLVHKVLKDKIILQGI